MQHCVGKQRYVMWRVIAIIEQRVGFATSVQQLPLHQTCLDSKLVQEVLCNAVDLFHDRLSMEKFPLVVPFKSD